MKKLTINVRIHTIFILLMVLLYAGCYEFDFVIQPHSADPNTTIETQFSVTTDFWGAGGNYIGYFGVKLPEDWVVSDSIPFESDTNSGVFIYNSALTSQVKYWNPPEEGYKWWVAQTADSVFCIAGDTYLFNSLITLGDSTGNFYITYFISDSDNGIFGEHGTIWSFDNLITVGLPKKIEVTNSSDNGSGTLREAVENIDYYGEINFDLPQNDTINLFTGIVLDKNLKIVGDSINRNIISGQDSTTIFLIRGFSSPLISNLILTDGGRVDGNPYADRYGIYCSEFNSPIFENTLIKNCSNSGLYFFSGCNPYFENVIVENNGHDYAGGGITFGSDCDPYLKNVTIRNNKGSYGGGIRFGWNCNPVFDSVDRCNIYYNQGYNGMDLYFYELDTIKVFLDTFSVATPTDYYAENHRNKMFDINHGIMQLIDSSFYISPDGDNNNSGLTPEDPLKTLAAAFSQVYVDSVNYNTVHLLPGNYGTEEIGVGSIYLPDFIMLKGNGIDEVYIHLVNSYWHINIYNNAFNEISGLTINHSEQNQSSLIKCTSSNTYLKNLKLNGEISCESGNIDIRESKIMNSGGLGIHLSRTEGIIENTEIYNNNSGGIACSRCSPTLLNLKIVNNGYVNYRSGIELAHSNSLIENCIIKNNKGYYGGGIDCGSSNPIISNTIISNNVAGMGGGVYSSNSNPLLKNVLISGNQSDSDGGGIALNRSIIDLTNVTIAMNNTDVNGNGGAIYCEDTTQIYFTNSILWGNEPEEIYFKKFDGSNSESQVTLAWTNIDGGTTSIETNNMGEVIWIDGCMSKDPEFVQDGDHIFQINDNSPCIDAGMPGTSGLPEFDPAGNPRIVNSRVDIGAYEWNLMVGGNDQLYENQLNNVVEIYPNPLNTSTILRSDFGRAKSINICIYSTTGTCLKSWELASQNSGKQEIELNLVDLPTGVYFIRINADNEITMKKIVKL